MTLAPPRHFFPAPVRERRVNSTLTARLPLPPSHVFPCGTRAGGPQLYTDDPHAVSCRRCIRSRLLQGLLEAGAGGAVHLDSAELERRGLIRRR